MGGIAEKSYKALKAVPSKYSKDYISISLDV